MSNRQSIAVLRALALCGAVGVHAATAVAGGPPIVTDVYGHLEWTDTTLGHTETVYGPGSVAWSESGTTSRGAFAASYSAEYGTLRVTADAVSTSPMQIGTSWGSFANTEFRDVIHIVGHTVLTFNQTLSGSVSVQSDGIGLASGFMETALVRNGSYLPSMRDTVDQSVWTGGDPSETYYRTTSSSPMTATLEDGDVLLVITQLNASAIMNGIGEAHAAFGSTGHLYIDVLEGGYIADSGTTYAVPAPGAAASLGMLAVFGARRRRR